jgi:hypothetical protein
MTLPTLLAWNELGSPAGSGRHCCNAAIPVIWREGTRLLQPAESGHEVRAIPTTVR